MATVKSSAENLTLNADGSGNDIIFQSNGSQVGSLTAEGVFTATSFAGSGAALTGITSVGGATGVDFNDNVKARFGTGNDLEIYHDASHSRIKDVGTGNLYISGSDQVNIQDAAGEPMINCVADGAVQLAHHGDYKLATSATGITVTGAIAGATNLGKILQVVYSNSSTATYPSTSFAAISSASITITPSATTSKILYIYNTGGLFNGNVQEMWLRMYRGGTTIRTYKRWGYASGQSGYQPLPWTWMYVDSPNTTSSIDYSLDAKENASAGWEINDTVGDGPGALVMAIEIGA